MKSQKQGHPGGDIYLIDSSVFLELFLGQEKARECGYFLEEARSGKIKCFVSDFNVDSILLAIERETKNPEMMERFLLSLAAYSGLSVYFHTLEDRFKALEIAKLYNLDFEDSMTFQAAVSAGCTKIVSFDRHFDNLPVKRIEPKRQAL